MRLQLLHVHGFVARRRDGLFAFYRLADCDVLRLCERAHQRLVAAG